MLPIAVVLITLVWFFSSCIRGAYYSPEDKAADEAYMKKNNLRL